MHHSFCIIVCYRAVRSAILATAGLLVSNRHSCDLCKPKIIFRDSQPLSCHSTCACELNERHIDCRLHHLRRNIQNHFQGVEENPTSPHPGPLDCCGRPIRPLECVTDALAEPHTKDGTGSGFLTRDPTRPDPVSSLNDVKPRKVTSQGQSLRK